MQTTLSKLFREIEAELGTHEFSIVALDALKTALLQYKIKTVKELEHQLLLIFKILKETKPRYAVLLDSFYKILDECKLSDVNSTIEDVITKIDRIIVEYNLQKLQLVQSSDQINLNGKSVLIHDHSHSVQSVLASMKSKGVEFEVVVAEQSIEKTHDNIEFLHSHGIKYKVVPAHMLSHLEESIDVLFCGAVTFQDNFNFVMDPGSKAIISHFHYEQKPIYVFITTSKFTLWPLTKESHEVYAKPTIDRHYSLPEIEYERIKFSHDRVPIELINYVVTEEGIHSQQEVKDIFEDMFKKRNSKRKVYFG